MGKLQYSCLILFSVLLNSVFSVNFNIGYDGSSSEEDDCYESRERDRPYCPKHWHLFKRKPSAENSDTPHWCLRVYLSENGTTQPDAMAKCVDAGGVLTTVDNAHEQRYVLKKARRFLNYMNLTLGSIWVDGQRVKICQTFNETQRASPPCNNSKTVFEMIDAQTNPAFIFTEWYAPSPSWSYYPYRVDKFVTYPTSESITANCINMLVEPSSRERHGKITDMHCNMIVPPYEQDRALLTNYGRLCGQAAKYK